MSVFIIGSGLAGLTTAIKTKLYSPNIDVAVLEKRHRESNTQIAGMRFRERLPGEPVSNQALIDLLSSRNNGEITSEMSQFTTQIGEELHFWHTLHTTISGISPLQSENESIWFGPQWGNGKGLAILQWLEHIAEKIGVTFVEGEALSLHRSGERIASVTVLDARRNHQFDIRAEHFVLANGSIGGNLFYSTNKEIRGSAPELAFEAKLPLVGSTTHMIHPFGRCREDGTPTLGCYATDDLEGYLVKYPDGSIDYEISRQLLDHTTHDFFPQIAKRFWERGGRVQLISPEGKISWARASHHYSQFGLKTADTVSVEGVNNLFTAGDAGSWRISNYATRFPGMGLSKCLVDAANIQTEVKKRTRGAESLSISSEIRPKTHESISKIERNAIKRINTEFLFRHIFLEDELLSGSWESELSRLGIENSLAQISRQMAHVHDLKREGKIQEPYTLFQKEGIIQEHLREIRPHRSKERK